MRELTPDDLGILLSVFALFLAPDAEQIDTWLVFIPGSIAMVCAVVLTAEVATSRATRLGWERRPGSTADVDETSS